MGGRASTASMRNVLVTVTGVSSVTSRVVMTVMAVTHLQTVTSPNFHDSPFPLAPESEIFRRRCAPTSGPFDGSSRVIFQGTVSNRSG